MNYKLLTELHPRIIDVLHLDRCYWKDRNYNSLYVESDINTLSYVYDGEGYLEYENESILLNPGSIIHNAPFSKFVIKTCATTCLQHFSFHFHYTLIKWEGINSETSRSFENRLPFPRVYYANDSHALYDKFRNAYNIWKEKKVNYEWSVKTSFYSILDLVCSIIEKDNDKKIDEDLIIEQHILGTVSYIKQNFQKQINREMLAKHAGLSPSYLSTKFKEQTGYTPIQYLTKVRIDKAKHLLRSTKMSISEIADEVGFSDSLYFSRVFSRETGLSPRAYKNL